MIERPTFTEVEQQTALQKLREGLEEARDRACELADALDIIERALEQLELEEEQKP